MKKLISLFLALITVLTVAPFTLSNLNASAANDSAGEIVEISSVNDLKELASNLNAYAVLQKDLEINVASWTPIGSQSAPFTGVFDGNGHTITYSFKFLKSSENNVEAGLFGCVTGEVKRLIVKGNINAKVNSGNIGSIAGKITNGGKIFNCYSYVNITVDSGASSAVGGIVGTVLKSSVYAENDSQIVRCESYGNIEAKVTSNAVSDGSALSRGTSGAVGGTVGLVADTANVKISKCINAGNITVDGGKYNIGGIVGQTSTDSSTSAVYITECVNKGDITVYNLAGERAAGIIAYVKSGNIDYCYNTGNIIAYSDNGKKVSTAGYGTYFGIFGYANLGSGNKLSVQYCYSASENELEAEICTVRNPSYGTFKNYYMKGRAEYETNLNSNAAAGKKGESFSDASDLAEKLTAVTDKYVSSEGYPILAWETDSVFSADKEIAVYAETREYDEVFDLRFVIHTAEKNAGSDLEVIFTLADGTTNTVSGKLGEQIQAVKSIYSADAAYIPASGYKLFALTLNEMEYSGWTNVNVNITSDGSELLTASLKYSELFEEALPSDIPIGDLPAFPEGKVSSVYNAGPGKVNDQSGTTPTDSEMVIISGVKSAVFKSYIETLDKSGYKCDFSNELDGNLYYSYSKDGKNYYIYYTSVSKEVRVILDKSSTARVTDLNDSEGSVSGTEVYQYAIDYTKGTGQTSGRDYWAIDCGMCYIIKFDDNSIFMIDGGHERQTSLSAMEALNGFLHEITGTAEGEKVRIAGWFFTHAHGDHVYLSHRFLELYHSEYELEAVYMNIPSYQVMSGGYDSGTFKMKDTVNKYYPDVTDYKLHTGQKFTIRGVEFEVLFTHEDAVNPVTATQKISNFNDSSTVIKTTINGKSVTYLGDIDSVAENIICSMFTEETLQSDAVQLSHHCFNNLPSLYKEIAAPLLLCPNSIENANGNSAKRQAAIDAAGADFRGILYAGKASYKLTFNSTLIEYEEIAPYWDTFFVTFPAALKTYSGDTVVEKPLDISAVLGKIEVSSMVYDKSATGTMGAKADEAPQTLFDGQTLTKWCVTSSKTSYVTWKTKEALVISAYQLAAGNDTSTHSGRNPQCWTLYGSLDGENWTVIDAVYNGGMSTQNYSLNTYAVDKPAEYQYYTLVIHNTVDGGQTMQISEIKLFTDN